MKKIDVAITAYANSNSSPYAAWSKDYFKDEMVIITVPGSGGAAFRAKIDQWAKTGDLFKAALTEQFPKYKDAIVNRRILVTFSAGWNAADALFKYDKEVNMLDAFILLDGMHSSDYTNWVKFAKRAVRGSAIFIMAHSSIKPPFISSTETNTKIFETAELISTDVKMDIPEYITNLALDTSITISLAASKDQNGKITLPAVSKIWAHDPLKSSATWGNVAILGYDGNDRPDHVYIAWYAAKKIWRWLGAKIEADDLADTNPDLEAPPVMKPKMDSTPAPEVMPAKEAIDTSFFANILRFFAKLFG